MAALSLKKGFFSNDESSAPIARLEFDNSHKVLLILWNDLTQSTLIHL